MAPQDDHSKEDSLAIDYEALYRKERQKQRNLLRKKNRTHSAGGTTSTSIASPNIDPAGKDRGLNRETKQKASCEIPCWNHAEPIMYIPKSGNLDTSCPLSHWSTLLGAPSTLYYHRDTISTEFEDQLVNWLEKLPINDEAYSASSGAWNILTHAKRKVSLFDGRTLSLPSPLNEIVQQLPLPTNHVLINCYESDHGILPHTDGPAYRPYTFTLSLADGCVFEIGARKTRLFLHQRSLILFKDQLYDEQHSIEESSVHDTSNCINIQHENNESSLYYRKRRYSLTFRYKV